MSKKTNTRKNIIHAAERLIQEKGVASLTLEAVAQAAGVSKGGLLYHFPSKDALIMGMITDWLEEFDGYLQEELAKEDDSKGAWLRAFIRASFTYDEIAIEARAGLLAALANNPDLLEPLIQQDKLWQEKAISAGIDPLLATILRLATDGYWYGKLLGLASITPALREQLLTRLLSLTYKD